MLIVSHYFYSKKTCKKEDNTIPRDLSERIARSCDRNLRRAILLLEATRVQQYPFTTNQELSELEWQVYLRETANQVLSEQSPAKLEKVRERLYELLAQGVPPDTIFKSLVENLVKKCDMTLKAKTIEFACLYDHRMQQGNKHIFYLEAFIANFMAIYKKFMNDMMMDF